MGTKGLSIYYPSLLCCLDQMLAVTKLSQHLVTSFKTVRPLFLEVPDDADVLNGRGAKTDLCGAPFFWRRSLLGLLSPVVRVKLLFRTSSMIIRTVCLSSRSLSSLQVRPRCQQLSDRHTRHQPSFLPQKNP